MNKDMTDMEKPQYPVIDPNPTYAKVVSNFNSSDCQIGSNIAATIGSLIITASYVAAEKRQSFVVMMGGTMAGLMVATKAGFMYPYYKSEGRLKGFYPNDAEVARYHHGIFTPLVLPMLPHQILFYYRNKKKQQQQQQQQQ